MEECEALHRLRRGEEQALVCLIERYGAYVSTIVSQILGPSAAVSDLEEVSSDVFFTLWNNAGRITDGKIKAYLGGVARNKAKEQIRKTGKELPLEDDVLLVSGEDPEHTLTQREQTRFLREAIISMESPEREIFLRYYYYCQPVPAIAKALNLNPGTIKTKLYRGRKKLKEQLIKGGYFVENSDF